MTQTRTASGGDLGELRLEGTGREHEAEVDQALGQGSRPEAVVRREREERRDLLDVGVDLAAQLAHRALALLGDAPDGALDARVLGERLADPHAVDEAGALELDAVLADEAGGAGAHGAADAPHDPPRTSSYATMAPSTSSASGQLVTGRASAGRRITSTASQVPTTRKYTSRPRELNALVAWRSMPSYWATCAATSVANSSARPAAWSAGGPVWPSPRKPAPCQAKETTRRLPSS
ncbi:MAG: hypothetical protein R3F59_09740 [Myxococcota bacterium]